ncbi:hypothetical protein [Alkalihalobacillus sp. AL-G]|uniref:hypothetical protein n=1 Tax=Alkalihalobacillus sp. AL-G TaxID=2926399 RepID=UPI0027296C71|nr:hypothetical protein [Alkalihalobacillus sp. AL-G]WLD92533.1 hypothetical protein MOJ78_16160 [Alkalihalobacillus sp. AL-G]
MDYSIQKERLQDASQLLLKQGIDVWMIVTSEGSDPCLPIVTGVETVGLGVFLITKNNERIAISSTIDAQDIVESDLFHEVKTYQGNAEEVLQETIRIIKPERIAVNYSQEDPVADGLTTGRFRWLKQTLDDIYPNEYESAEPILQQLRKIEST